MLTNIIHIGLACLVGYCVFYAVYHNKTDDNDDADAFAVEESFDEIDSNNITMQMIEELFEDADISFVVPEEELMYTVIEERYLVGEVMAVGHIGRVHSGVDQDTESDVVIKFVQPGPMAEFLENEYQNYLLLGAQDPAIMKHGVPNVLFFGEHGGYKVLVMQMLGPTLKEMKDFSKKQKFSGKTILKIAIQLMDVFNHIHLKGLFIYDITSANIAIGNSRENMNRVFVFDFASSVEISREFLPKDDLLLLGLVLLELNGVNFPSRKIDANVHTNTDQIIESLLTKWDDNYIKELCSNSDQPEIFLEFFEALASMKPNEFPDYGKLKKIFGEGLTFEEMKKDSLGIFDIEF